MEPNPLQALANQQLAQFQPQASGYHVPDQQELQRSQLEEQARLLALHGQTPVADHYGQQMVNEQPNHEAAQDQYRSAGNWGTLGGGMYGAAWPMVSAANPVTAGLGLGLGVGGSAAMGVAGYKAMDAALLDRAYQQANAVNQNFTQNAPAAQMPMNYAGRGSQHLLNR